MLVVLVCSPLSSCVCHCDFVFPWGVLCILSVPVPYVPVPAYNVTICCCVDGQIPSVMIHNGEDSEDNLK
jgi:hypothetical protein